MIAPTGLYGVGGAEGSKGIKLARLDPNFPAVLPPNQYPRSNAIKNCANCHGHFRPARSWHQTCGACWQYSKLLSVVSQFNRVVRR